MRGGSFSDGTIVIGTNVDTAGINSGLQRINKTIKRFIGVTALLQFGKAAIKAASDLQEVQNIVDVTFGDLEDKMERFASISIETYGLSEFMAKSIAGSFMAMGRASGIAADDAANMALQLTALAGDMASFYNISQEYARVALSAVYTGETETLKRYGIILTEANLQEYAHTLGIETKVKAMDASTKAMLRYKYILEQTQHIQGDFVRTQDNWANQLRVLKERWRQLLITIGSGLITIGSPILKALNNILQAVTAWANAVGKIIAKLLGIEWQDFTSEMGQLSDATVDAGESEEDLADGIGKATKAAKKALMPFDELNVLTRKTADNASGLATDLGLGVADFETAFDVDGKGFEIKPPDISSWYEFGKYISDTLGGLLDKIDWAYIQEKAKTFAHNFAEFLNGFFQKENFEKIGHTLAEALNTIVDYAFEFGTTFDFENFGKTLAAGVNKFFTDFDFKQFANTIDTWVQGLWSAIKAFFKGDENGEGGIDWPAVRNALNDFFSELDIETVGLIIGYLFIKKVSKIGIASAVASQIAAVLGPKIAQALAKLKLSIMAPQTAAMMFGPNWITKLSTFIRGKFAGTGMTTMAQAGANAGSSFLSGFTTALQGIAGVITAIIGGTMAGTGAGYSLSYLFGGDTSTYDKYLGLEGVIPLFKDLGKAIVDVATDGELFMDTIKGMFADTAVAQLLPSIKKALEELKLWFGDVGYAIVHIFGDARDFVISVWSSISTWFSTNVIQPILSAFNAISEWWTNFVGWWGAIFQDVWIIVKAVWIVVSDWFHEHVVQKLIDLFTTYKDFVIQVFTNIKDKIVYIWSFVTGWFYSEVLTPLVAHFTVFWEAVKNGFTMLWENIKTVWGAVTSWFNSVITSVQAYFTTFWYAVQNGFTLLWASIQEVWGTVVSWFTTTVIDPIKNGFQHLWDSITSGVKDALNFAIGIVEGFVNKVIDAINSFTSGLSTIASVAATITGDSYSSIGQIPHVSLPRLATGAVIPPNKEFMAILGDQKHGTNIEAPLDTIVDAFKIALNGGDNNMVGLMLQQVELLGIIANKEFGISEGELFNSVKKSASRWVASTGESAF